MKKLSLTIGHLYADLMNTYGDDGNIITFKKRCEWRGIEVKVKNISIKDRLNSEDVDLYFFGGGQDEGQVLVSQDLQSGTKNQLIKEVERGVPLLAICGGYQLLGDYYKPQNGPKLAGLGIFPVYTNASDQRMIGNLVIELGVGVLGVEGVNTNTPLTSNSLRPNLLVGFENHSGKTYLKEGAKSLGKVVKGFGNNGEDGIEGCIYKNAIGCYMHGSLLPKNPQLADWLIQKALEIKYGEKSNLEPLNDELENDAHEIAVQKFS
jgi:lipid II isoglutaminyl synthase (glutamine-hydrolysing)